MSLKGDKYETLEEVKFRLEKTVVLYDDKPVFITRVGVPENKEERDEIARVYFQELPLKGRNQIEQRKYLSSRKFDLTPFKMGYCNFADELVGCTALFVSRNPVRQNKQGLCQQTCVITDARGRRTEDYGFVSLLGPGGVGFTDMIAGKFPSFQEVGEMLSEEGNESVALSRQFAFIADRDLEAFILVHKGVKCGIAMKDDKSIRISGKYHFLRQEAEECRIPLS